MRLFLELVMPFLVRARVCCLINVVATNGRVVITSIKRVVEALGCVTVPLLSCARSGSRTVAGARHARAPFGPAINLKYPVVISLKSSMVRLVMAICVGSTTAEIPQSVRQLPRFTRGAWALSAT